MSIPRMLSFEEDDVDNGTPPFNGNGHHVNGTGGMSRKEIRMSGDTHDVGHPLQGDLDISGEDDWSSFQQQPALLNTNYDSGKCGPKAVETRKDPFAIGEIRWDSAQRAEKNDFLEERVNSLNEGAPGDSFQKLQQTALSSNHAEANTRCAPDEAKSGTSMERSAHAGEENQRFGNDYGGSSEPRRLSDNSFGRLDPLSRKSSVEHGMESVNKDVASAEGLLNRHLPCGNSDLDKIVEKIKQASQSVKQNVEPHSTTETISRQDSQGEDHDVPGLVPFKPSIETTYELEKKGVTVDNENSQFTDDMWFQKLQGVCNSDDNHASAAVEKSAERQSWKLHSGGKTEDGSQTNWQDAEMRHSETNTFDLEGVKNTLKVSSPLSHNLPITNDTKIAGIDDSVKPDGSACRQVVTAEIRKTDSSTQQAQPFAGTEQNVKKSIWGDIAADESDFFYDLKEPIFRYRDNTKPPEKKVIADKHTSKLEPVTLVADGKQISRPGIRQAIAATSQRDPTREETTSAADGAAEISQCESTTNIDLSKDDVFASKVAELVCSRMAETINKLELSMDSIAAKLDKMTKRAEHDPHPSSRQRLRRVHSPSERLSDDDEYEIQPKRSIHNRNHITATAPTTIDRHSWQSRGSSRGSAASPPPRRRTQGAYDAKTDVTVKNMMPAAADTVATGKKSSCLVTTSFKDLDAKRQQEFHNQAAVREKEAKRREAEAAAQREEIRLLEEHQKRQKELDIRRKRCIESLMGKQVDDPADDATATWQNEGRAPTRVTSHPRHSLFDD